MIKIKIPAKEQEQLSALRYSHPNRVVRRRFAILKLAELQRGETQTKVFLRKIGLKPRKTAAIPAKANIEAQEDFKKKVWCRN